MYVDVGRLVGEPGRETHGGMKAWCMQLYQGMSEARFRELLMRSPEFVEKNKLPLRGPNG